MHIFIHFSAGMLLALAAADDCQPKACPAIWKPICAKQGDTQQTYGSDCVFEAQTCGQKGN